MPRKRSSGDGALYQDKKRKLWKGVIDDGYWPDGRRRQRTVTSRTKTGARDKLDALKQEIEDHGAPLDKTTTVAKWANTWLDTVCRPNMKPNGLAAYESVTRTWIIPTIGQKTVASLKPSDIRLVHRAILDKGRSTATAVKAHNILSGMLEAARREKLAPRNVVADVDPPKVKANSRDAIPAEMALRVFATAMSDPDGSRWLVSMLYGLRQGERLGMLIESVDFKNEKLGIEWALDEVPFLHGCGEQTDTGWPCGKKRGGSCANRRLKVPDGLDYRQIQGRLCLLPPKSGKPRYPTLLPEVAAILRRQIAATADLPNPHGLVWRHEDGSPYLPAEDQAAWRDLLHRAGAITDAQLIPGTDGPTTHWARHTAVTVLMELGVDAKIIGEIVGHVSEKTTRGYQHVSSPAARDAMERIGRHFGLLAIEPLGEGER